jgi:hypothetical protein
MATLQQQKESYLINLAKNLQKAGFVVEGEMHNLVAIKTGALDRDISTDEVVRRENVLSVDVGNDGGVSYAPFVEGGVKGRTYNYHRRGEIVFTGVGQHYQARAVENKKNQILQLLKSTRI